MHIYESARPLAAAVTAVCSPCSSSILAEGMYEGRATTVLKVDEKVTSPHVHAYLAFRCLPPALCPSLMQAAVIHSSIHRLLRQDRNHHYFGSKIMFCSEVIKDSSVHVHLCDRLGQIFSLITAVHRASFARTKRGAIYVNMYYLY